MKTLQYVPHGSSGSIKGSNLCLNTLYVSSLWTIILFCPYFPIWMGTSVGMPYIWTKILIYIPDSWHYVCSMVSHTHTLSLSYNDLRKPNSVLGEKATVTSLVTSDSPSQKAYAFLYSMYVSPKPSTGFPKCAQYIVSTTHIKSVAE